MLRVTKVYSGSLNTTVIRVAEVFREAIRANSAGIIVAHNHPSGDPTPSKADITMTREVAAAAKALGIAIHDHLVIGRGGHASFKSLGLL